MNIYNLLILYQKSNGLLKTVILTSLKVGTTTPNYLSHCMGEGS